MGCNRTVFIATPLRGSAGALAPPPPEFGGSEKRTKKEKDNLLLITPTPESKS